MKNIEWNVEDEKSIFLKPLFQPGKWQKNICLEGQKDERINIRLATKDLMGIQKKTMQEGLPYQTLISSVLQKYVTGQLKPVEAE